MRTMLKLMAGCVICVAQADIGLNGSVAGGVLFGADGLVEERSAAVGELAPWPSAFRMWTVERRRNHLAGK